MTTCLFCTEAASSTSQLAASARAYLCRDNYLAAEGHMQVVPTQHARTLVPADGWTIGVNEGRAAGRTIDHVHLHLIPRRHGDVPDPRGGIRTVLPAGPHPSAWVDQAVTR